MEHNIKLTGERVTYAIVGKFAKRKGVQKDKFKSPKESESLLNLLLVCRCGWEGSHKDLVKNGCLSYGDEWYECPSCGGDADHRMEKR